MALKFRKDFLESQRGEEIRLIFKSMTLSKLYNTSSTYSSDKAKYPDSMIPFIDKHMNYLIAHPKLEAYQYIANIKLMTRVR